MGDYAARIIDRNETRLQGYIHSELILKCLFVLCTACEENVGKRALKSLGEIIPELSDEELAYLRALLSVRVDKV